MKHAIAIWVVVALALLTGLVLFFWPEKIEPPPEPVDTAPPPAQEAPPPAAPDEAPAQTRAPGPAPPPGAGPEDEEVPWYERDAEAPPAFVEEQAEPAQDEAPEAPALPALAESDEEVTAALEAAAGSRLVERHLVSEDVVRRVVATVDNVPREHIGPKVRAIPPVDGRFRVTRSDEEIFLDPDNYERYARMVDLVGAVDAETLAAAYVRYYPLLQEAYAELGYPTRQFHARVLEVIDHLLATPEVSGPIRLERPHVLYQFADPALESLSAGQKALIRLGPRHAAVVKGRLRALRAALEARVVAPEA